jgi:hypothetical protein
MITGEDKMPNEVNNPDNEENRENTLDDIVDVGFGIGGRSAIIEGGVANNGVNGIN